MRLHTPCGCTLTSSKVLWPDSSLCSVCCTGITSWLYTHSDNDHCSSALTTIPIGRGIHNAHLYVLDARLQPVPVGVPGQLFISGVQVTAGYLNRTNLTEEVFVPNPFCEGPGTHTDKMYRTGDLVLWLPGQRACLGCLGRVDYQVRIRQMVGVGHGGTAMPASLQAGLLS